MVNPGSDSRSATLEVLNPQTGLGVALSSGSTISLAAGETVVVPVSIDAGQVPTGKYDGIQVKITADDGSTIYTNITVLVVPQGTPNLPDLTLTSNDIRLTSVNGDGTVTLAADIHNQGTASASNVLVQFNEFGSQVGQVTLASVPSNGVRTASITIPMAGSGDYLIQVVIDPAGAIQELDKTNNEASQVIQPSGPSVSTEGNMLVTGSMPSTVYTNSLFSISGSAVYDLLVNGIRNSTDYAVKGGAVQITIIGSGGAEWVYRGSSYRRERKFS